MTALDDGTIWLSTPRYTVGLVVTGGRIADCPPLARRWAYGKVARDVWSEAAVRGASLQWLDESHPCNYNNGGDHVRSS